MKKEKAKSEKTNNGNEIKRDAAVLAIAGVALLIDVCGWNPWGWNGAWIAVVLCGVPIVWEAAVGFFGSLNVKTDFLVALALLAALALGETFVAGEVVWIMKLGALLEEWAVARARSGIEKLEKLTPLTARLVGENGSERSVPVEEVAVGARVRVLPGETVPLDGEILFGATSVDQSVATGESLPVDKSLGDKVLSGTLNLFGAFEMAVEKSAADSSIQRTIRWARSVDVGKTRIVRIADRWATYVVIGALVIALGVWLATGDGVRAATVLIVFCPCALTLATPTAVAAAISAASRRGVLVREGDAFERLATVSTVCWDKTGTLTVGKPEVVGVATFNNRDENELLTTVVAVEQFSEHPLAKAIVRRRRETFAPTKFNVERFVAEPGRGAFAVVDGEEIFVGSERAFAERKIAISDEALAKVERFVTNGCAVVYVAIDGAAAGAIFLSDVERSTSAAAIERLQSIGVRSVMLTGDGDGAATVARGLGIDEFFANCLPEDKLLKIEALQEAGERVCMVGDGVNDAPALAKANVGVALGSENDFAATVADFAILNSDVKEVASLLSLARRTTAVIRFNLAFSLALNFLAVALAASGWLGPVLGAFAHNGGSLLVVANAALLTGWREKESPAASSVKRGAKRRSTESGKRPA